MPIPYKLKGNLDLVSSYNGGARSGGGCRGETPPTPHTISYPTVNSVALNFTQPYRDASPRSLFGRQINKQNSTNPLADRGGCFL